MTHTGKLEGAAAGRLPAREQLAARLARCAALRDAWLALAPAAGDVDEGLRLADQLRAAVGELEAHARAAAAGSRQSAVSVRDRVAIAAEGEAIDAALARETQRLVAVADALPSAGLRAALREIETKRSAEALALVDLLASSESARALLADLVALLATEEVAGRRRVVRDPATLTPGLQALCARSAETAHGDLVAFERRFVEAAARCESEPLGAVACEVAALRTQLGEALFAPRALRAAVFFDAALWSALGARTTLRAGPTSTTPGLARADAAPVPSSQPSAAAPGAEPAPAFADDVVRWRIEDAPHLRPAPRRWRRPAWVRHAAKASLFAGVLVTALRVYTGEPRSIVTLSATEVHSVAPWLASGYRSIAASKALFVGTVVPDWPALPLDRRESQARALASRLGSQGVSKILLYDDRHLLVFHYARGLPFQLTR